MSTPTTKHKIESQSPNNSELDIQQELTYIASGTALMFGGTLFSNVISLGYGVLTARVVGAKLLGIFYLGLSVVGFIGPFAILGLSNGLLRYIPLFYAKGDFQAIRRTIRWVLSFVATISTLLTFVLFLLAKIIAVNWFHQPELTVVLVLLAITAPLGCIGSICLCSVQALHQIKYRVYVECFITPAFRLIVVGGLFLLGWRLMAVVTAHLASVILSLGMAGYYLRKVLQKQPYVIGGTSQNVSMSQIVRFSLPLFLSSIFRMFPKNLITWLLGIFSAEAVAIYGIASRLSILGTYVLHSLNSVFAPMISGLSGSGQLKELEQLYKTATRWLVFLSMPIYLLMILLAQKFLYLYGEAFIVGAIPLMILCLGEIVNAGVGSAGYMVVMSGHPKIHLCNEIVTAVLTTVLSFIAIPKYGVLGAAIAVTIAVAFVNLVRCMEVYYFLRIHPYDLNYVKLISPVVVASLSLIGIQNIFSIRFPYNLIIYSLTFGAIYIGLLLVSGLSQEDNRLLQSIKLKISNNFQKMHIFTRKFQEPK